MRDNFQIVQVIMGGTDPSARARQEKFHFFLYEMQVFDVWRVHDGDLILGCGGLGNVRGGQMGDMGDHMDEQGDQVIFF